MKKIVLLVSITAVLVSCTKEDIKPIEQNDFKQERKIILHFEHNRQDSLKIFLNGRQVEPGDFEVKAGDLYEVYSSTTGIERHVKPDPCFSYGEFIYQSTSSYITPNGEAYISTKFALDMYDKIDKVND